MRTIFIMVNSLPGNNNQHQAITNPEFLGSPTKNGREYGTGIVVNPGPVHLLHQGCRSSLSNRGSVCALHFPDNKLTERKMNTFLSILIVILAIIGLVIFFKTFDYDSWIGKKKQ